MILAGTTACSAFGDAPHLAAALRAGMDRFQEDKALACRGHDPEWDPPEPARIVRVPGLPAGAAGADRLLALAAAAARDLAGRGNLRRADLPAAALLIGLPAIDAVTGGWNLPGLAQRLAGDLGLAGLAAVESLPTGRTALFAVLERAQALLAGGKVRTVLAVVADSLLDAQRFRALDEARRVRSTRAPGGMLPGEAAVGLVLTAAGAGSILGTVGRGREGQPLGGPQASSGSGLQDAVAAALHGPSAWVLPDLTGEEYRTREWAVVLTRARLDARAPLLTCAALGDAGAANAAIALAVADAGLARRWARGPALITACDDDGGRAAVTLERKDA